MINPINHYSFENIPTVYDEEALTVLELCARLGRKVNELIEAVNGMGGNGKPDGGNTVSIKPTGDTTGEADRALIQAFLDAGANVWLVNGEYYLNGPLIFRAGYMLRGDSQLNTVLNCKATFIDHADVVSVDHVQVCDIRVKGPAEGVGIDISRKVQGVETGGRYAHFMNVYISGYDTAIRLGGCWCTNFTHCRIEAENICVEQRGSCNHVKYDHCMFLGPVDKKTSTAVKITAEDGAENYGITFDHCDFERHKYAIHAYYCVALNVNSVYVEGVDTVFQLDSCPSFLCSGGYISYPRIVLQGGRTNEVPLYAKSGGAIRNVFVRCATAENFYLVSTPDAYPVELESMTVINDNGGEVWGNAQNVTSMWNGMASFPHVNITFTGTFTEVANAVNNAWPGFALQHEGWQYKFTHATVRFNEAANMANKQGNFNFYFDGVQDDNHLGHVLSIPAQSFSAGDTVTSYSRFTEYDRYVFNHDERPTVKSAGYLGDYSGKVTLTLHYRHGKMKY